MNLNKGYSLIEILVVLSIFSLMSLLILSFTNISVNSSLLVSEETNKLRRLINTSEIIKDDLIHSINKPLKNTNTNYRSSFFAQNDWLEGEPFLEFTRHSESEGVQETGVYQRIKYVLEDGRIERYSTDSLLSEYNTSPITLLVEVDSVNVIAFKERNYNFWPIDESLNLPKFLEITLQFKDDVFQKIFLVDD
jgi:type II secretion system protein J|tara:strand:- start:5 stop:583 length:579 start_codon:yes stop_codon:yes gene_type:complete